MINLVNKKIYIEKLAEVPGGYSARNMKDHLHGQYQNDGFSLPIQYNLEGFLLHDIEIGSRVLITRTKRNDVEAPGQFISSLVVETGENYFKTENSVYYYKFI